LGSGLNINIVKNEAHSCLGRLRMLMLKPDPIMTEARLRVGKILQMAQAGPGKKALLLGDGEGMLAGSLRRAGVEITWLEPAPDGRTRGNSPLPSQGFKRMIGDLRRLPFEEEGLDLIASQLTLEYQEDPAGLLAEWMRVLKKTGVLILVTSNGLFKGHQQRPGPRAAHSFTLDELRNLLEPLGLKDIEACTLIPELKLPGLYRGDLSFYLRLAELPYFGARGRLLFLKGVKG
jgi:SAM-dependent methyltransferase